MNPHQLLLPLFLVLLGIAAAQDRPAIPKIAGADAVRETLPPLQDGKAPKNYKELWAQFDPRLEPLEIEILKEWEEDGVVLQVLRYRVGVFKGEKAMVAAVFGYPKGGEKKLPGLVQIHGGGQYADYQAVLTNAKRGYVTISIAWAGRISAPDYRVSPAEVKLFWDGATTDPSYRVTTDWGALDGYHAPSKNPKNVFPKLPEPAPWTLDGVKSPRNNGWFLCTLAARRALTLLELHPRVAPDKLGVYGHSMGGKLTVMTAATDDRVKAAAPSCGGVSDRYNKDPLFRATIGDEAYLRHLSCPVMFLSPANDFHGRINDLQTAVTEIAAKEWRATCSPHHNHQDSAQYEVATQLWFDQYLKGTPKLPETPSTSIALSTKSQIPSYSVRPDSSRRILAVDVFYTQQGRADGERVNAIHQFWHHAPTNEDFGFWMATLPLWTNKKPLWVYANVTYALGNPISGAGYYYGRYTADRFTISSKMTMVTAELLQGNGAKAILKPSLMIEKFEGDWQKEWFTYKPEHWARKTHKVYHPMWAAPKDAKLAIGVRSAKANKLVIGIDQFAAEVEIEGGSEWRELVLAPSDFRDATGATMASWAGIKELRLGDQETLRDRKQDRKLSLGASWKGERPAFRTLRWVR